MERTVPFLNGCISFVAFVTAVTLVVYMLIVIVTGTYDVANTMLETVFLDSSERQSVFNFLNAEFLHNVAVLLILMKAYRLLVEYMRHQHIDIKYMVEIAIVACVLELLFNYNTYGENMRYILFGLAVSFLGVYVFGYKTLKQSTKDAQKEIH
ncbi:phosphate-starvation-inducible PsiE family protein [Candidatus Pacebacteria bacterium]|nr:phosphate-starvation-inducible PsiE family protein [Candidatus Paceibacterota bacterium]